jgi:predicted RNA polymerase sigma factor
VARLDAPAESSDVDDSLTLLYLCCHPSLTPPSAIALTLRAVGGLTTAQIARAFLVPEATMAQRISRAKATIRAAGARFLAPEPAERAGRTGVVLHVLYLLFNEGYAASSGAALQRVDLSTEAVRLTRLAVGLLPEDAEAAGLLALMLLTDARRPARTDAQGLPIRLEAQDRGRWDQSLIREGTALLDSVIVGGRPGPYQVQAAIAAVHDRATRPEDTDWPQILALHGLLEGMTGSPVVTLSRAVAAGEADGPAAGLGILETVGEPLRSGHRYAAVRAHLLARSGDLAAAAEAYRMAARLATNLAEQRALIREAARLHARAPGVP